MSLKGHLKIGFLFLVLLTFFRVSAQERKINFKHISYKEGLVQSPISSFLQDEKGFIWFGNLKGLTRYDGYEFKNFVHVENDHKSISNNRVNVIFLDKDKHLWIGTANGLNLYNPDLETFQAIDVRDVKGGRNFISSIAEDQNKNLWIGTYSGIKKLNKKTLKLEDATLSNVSNNLNQVAIFSLFSDKQNNLWVGTRVGLRRLNPVTNQEIALPAVFTALKSFSGAKVLVMRQDNAHSLWFGTEISGVFRYQAEPNIFSSYVASSTNSNSLSSNWVKDILVFGEDELWFATQKGISILHVKSNSFTNYKHNPTDLNGLSDNAIWSFFKDKSGCVWVGTYSGGINFYYKGNSNFLNILENPGQKLSLDHPLVNAISEDDDGSLWIGTYGGGLNHINRATNICSYYSVTTPDQERASNGVKSLADDKKGNLWLGLLDGMIRFNKKSKKSQYYSFPAKEGKISEKLINTVLPDGDGVWVGTNGGGLRYVLPGGKDTVFLRSDQSHALSDNYVTAIIKDAKANLWVGTQNGLNYYSKVSHKFEKLYKWDRTRFLKGDNQISNSNISNLFLDSNHRLWVGTEGGGLNYFDPITEKFFIINDKLGLPDNVIHSIVEDKQHNIWVSTDYGLVKIDFHKNGFPFKKSAISLTTYSANDGLASNQFSHGSGLLLKSGEIAFGGLNGLSIFYPDKITRNTIAPHVVLTDILINTRKVLIDTLESPLQKSISQTSKIILSNDQAYISLKYAALNFINPENNHYAYKLEGLPNGGDWQMIGNQRVVNFANLLPGTYTFKVKASNNDNIWGVESSGLKIIILPPWWKTWWAYLLYTLMVSVIIYVIVRFLRNRALLKKDLYLEHLHNERQQDLYQMKLNFFTNISHEIRTPLTLILGPLEKMLISFRKNESVWNQLTGVKNNADRLMRLVTELMDFRKAETGHMKLFLSQQNIVKVANEVFMSFQSLALSTQIDYQFIADEEEILLYFDKDQLEKVLYNLLSNAFKTSPAKGCIRLSVRQRNVEGIAGVLIRVTDNGKGISPENQDKLFDNFFQVDDHQSYNRGFGIGLALSKSIVELHHGSIKVESKAESGTQSGKTIFKVFLKSGYEHFSGDQVIIEKFKGSAENSLLPVNETFITNEDEVIAALEHKYSILIVEDNAEVRNFLANSLQKNYKITAAADGLAGWEIACSQIPDLVISDVMMPEMDGFELSRRIKTDERTSHIPVILLTAKADYIHQLSGLETGADAYISKPFSMQLLELNVRNILASKEVIRKKFSQRVTLLPQNPETASPDEKFLSKLMKIIESRMENPEFGVTDVVDEIGMSKTVLYNKVKALTGYSIADLIKSIRLKKAALLLEENILSISEISFTVGFNDRKYFSKEFKKQFGKAPSSFIDDISSVNTSTS